MPRIEHCSFCSKPVYPGKGICFVRNDSRVFRFCTSKCHRNFKMKRNPRKVRWTKTYRLLHNKDMATDSTYDFERRRNRAVKYDRNLWEKAVHVIDRVTEIQHARTKRHINSRKREHALKMLATESAQKHGFSATMDFNAVDPLQMAAVEKVRMKKQIKERPYRPILRQKEIEARERLKAVIDSEVKQPV
ncbi:LSU ribosomal protein L24E [Giardia duodenalis assemblage B]|uniref:LSU ribosomal protein L24E n=3 Tax=Giardia intestinalis TaxID=5741 RepID=A0A132NN86_GIAIN|nr:Ribosomal protein L24 [Giardia intestinalis ATCC 50581]KWX11560.1 LSU ribosomal protein L24E [Giardia intestinalis assemblage B]